MKDTFKEYYPLSSSEIKNLWQNSIFIFDTNILLNLYRYSSETSLNFLETIENLKKVWIPYQVGYEFHKKRMTVISDQRKSYEDFEKKINEIISAVEDKNRNPFFSNDLLEKLTKIKEIIQKEVSHNIKHYDDALIKDNYLDRIQKLFDNKVGTEPSLDILQKIYSEGEKRYKENIPPGFKDNSKQGNGKFGDLLIWKQIIDKAKADSCDIIFISDDRKEDWWLEHQGKTISPRPELLKEFRLETSKSCHFYKPFQFLEFSNKYLNSKVKNEVIEEVKNYKFKNISDNNYVFIYIILKGSEPNVSIFINDLKFAGYNIFEQTVENNLHNITIILPKIHDLERRLNEKYFNNLQKYDIELIKISSR